MIYIDIQDLPQDAEIQNTKCTLDVPLVTDLVACSITAVSSLLVFRKCLLGLSARTLAIMTEIF
jgi:hypothetical protein